MSEKLKLRDSQQNNRRILFKDANVMKDSLGWGTGPGCVRSWTRKKMVLDDILETIREMWAWILCHTTVLRQWQTFWMWSLYCEYISECPCSEEIHAEVFGAKGHVHDVISDSSSSTHNNYMRGAEGTRMWQNVNNGFIQEKRIMQFIELFLQLL